jgi:hypothetical protein
MFELKPLSPEAIPKALERAERYRLLSEPRVAESICHDILRTEPEHQQALTMLILALTDQFGKEDSAALAKQALEWISQLKDEYARAYYTGIVYERQAKAILNRNLPGAAFDAYDLLREAMGWFEKAEAMLPAGNEDAILRWNTCVRLIMNKHLTPRAEEGFEPALE